MIGHYGQAIEVADQTFQAHATKQAACEALIPKVCDALIEHKRIQPEQREKLAERLNDPEAALDLMIKLAGHRNADELAHLGQPVAGNGQTKTAGHNPADSLTNPHVGRRSTQTAESDVRLFAGLGMSSPGNE
jgi:hypothetical protein